MFTPKLALVFGLQFVLLMLGIALALLGERRQPDDLLTPDNLTGKWAPPFAGKARGWPPYLGLDGPPARVARAVVLAFVPLPALCLWAGVPAANPLAALLGSALCAALAFALAKVTNGSGFNALSFCAAAGALAIVVGVITRAGGALSPPSAGSVIACTLLFGTAISVRAGATGRQLFERATLDIGQHNPLHLPFPHTSTAQLRCALVAAVVAGWLAGGDIPYSALGTAPEVMVLLLAAAMQIWGWRAKELQLAGVAVAAFVSLGATLLLRTAFTGSAGVRSLFLALKTAPFASNLDSRGFVILGGLLLLIGASELLRRPPDRLSRVVGHAPGWGWMLIGGLGASVAAACFPGGGALSIAMMGTLCSGFLFVWLCQWD